MSLVEAVRLAFNSFDAGMDSKQEAIESVISFVSENYESKQELDKMDIQKAHENYIKDKVYLHCENGHVLFVGIECEELN